jgi:translation initiation factor eIF-2B subunit epsilon
MAKKNKKESEGGGSNLPAKREEPLQAVLLAEDWSNSHVSEDDVSTKYPFSPLTLDRPLALCSFLNAKSLLDYTIQYLDTQGVSELYVVCVTEAVEEYISEKYIRDAKRVSSSMITSMKVCVIRDTTISNAGDALRELDKRNNTIKSDPFVLVHSPGVITNCDLKEYIAAHKKRHSKDSSAMFTMIFKTVGSSSAYPMHRHAPIRPISQDGDLLVALDPHHENRVLLYEDHRSRNSHDSSVNSSIPCSFFSGTSEIQLRTDLLDIGLDLCSPDVLARFSDNFDYRDIRYEFVRYSVAEEEEGLQNRLYAVLLPPATYAARIADARTYHAVAQDVLRRFAYPVVPDNYPSDGNSGSYQIQRHYLYHYQENGDSGRRARVARSATLRGPGLIAANVFIGEHCRISSSVIAEYCHIAENVQVDHSHLWESVTLEANCVVSHSILACGVIVKTGAVIPRGCIIGENCIIGANVHLPEYTRLTTTCRRIAGSTRGEDEDWEDSSGEADELCLRTESASELVSDIGTVGIDGKGRVWLPEINVRDDESMEDADMSKDLIEQILHAQCIGFEPNNFLERNRHLQKLHDNDDFSVNDGGFGPEEDDEDSDFYASNAVDFDRENPDLAKFSQQTIIGRQEGVNVIKELKAICLEFELSTSPIENLAIELNSYKFSQNASYVDCCHASFLAILEKMSIRADMTDGKLVTEFKVSLEQWAPLLHKMSIGLDEEKAIILALERCAVGDFVNDGDGEQAMMDPKTVEAMQHVLSSGMSFRLLLQTLHDEDIVSEDAVLAWAAERREQDGDKDTPRGNLFRLEPVQEFLEWLQEEGDDSDDSEEDDVEEA